MEPPLPPDDRDPPDDPDRLPDDRVGVDRPLDEALRLTVEGEDCRVEELLLMDRDEDRGDVLSRLAGLSTERDDFPDFDLSTALPFVDPRSGLGRFTFLPVSRLSVVRSVPLWIVLPELSFLRRGSRDSRISLDLVVDSRRVILSRPYTTLRSMSLFRAVVPSSRYRVARVVTSPRLARSASLDLSSMVLLIRVRAAVSRRFCVRRLARIVSLRRMRLTVDV